MNKQAEIYQCIYLCDLAIIIKKISSTGTGAFEKVNVGSVMRRLLFNQGVLFATGGILIQINVLRLGT